MSLVYLRFFILLHLFVSAALAYDWPCPSECNCHLKSVDCSYRRLTAVPKNFPPFVERIDLRGNEIESLNHDDFAGLTKLKILLLNDNLISRIDAGVFDDSISLQRIRLNRNQLQSLDDGLFARLNTLNRLDLSDNLLTTIGPRTLEGLENVINLQLDNNRLVCVSPKVISRMTYLEILTLSSNNLTVIPEGLLNSENDHRLRLLRLNDNPVHCDCGTTWLVEWLHRHVGLGPMPKCKTPDHVSGVMITQTNHYWRNCEGNEELARANQLFVKAAMQKCSEPEPCPLGCHCNGPIISCEGPQIDQIPTEGLPTDMIELRINRARLPELPELAFAKYSNLRSLEISDSFVHKISPTAFAGLSNLRSLTLFGNKIEDLPETMFTDLHSLETLYLNNNHMRCLRRKLFDPLRKLRILSLFDNQLSSIANGTFDSLANLTILHLGQNPFICDCNLKWLFDFLQSHPALEKTNVRCDAPARTRRKRVLTAGSDTFECRTRSEYLRTSGAGQCRIEPSCPEACRCSDTNIDCSNVGFIDAQLLPPYFIIPSYTQALDLSDNNLAKFPAHLLAEADIRKLSLRGNKITTLTQEQLTADTVAKLSELDLSNNEIVSIQHGIFDNMLHLTKLNLDDNKLPCISNATFSSLLGRSSLVTLSVANNQLRCIQPLGPSSTTLREFNFLGNPITCDCQLKEFISWLENTQAVHLGNYTGRCVSPAIMNDLEITLLRPDQVKCEDKRQSEVRCNSRNTPPKIIKKTHQCCPIDLVVDESEVSVASIEQLKKEALVMSEIMCDAPAAACPEKCTCEDHGVIRCSRQQLTAIPDNLPLDTAELYLDHNNVSTLNFSSLAYLPKLRRIDLSFNKLTYLGDSELSPQHGKTLPRKLHLDSLILNFNPIRCIHLHAFVGLDHLRLLLLHGSNLSTLPFGLFDPVPRLQLLGLGQNPLYCDCNLKWLSDTVKKSFIESGIATCTGPSDLADSLLLTAESSRFQCTDNPVPSYVTEKCDSCESVTCNNVGTCRVGEKGYPDYTCDCQQGYEGKNCEAKINACYSKPCLNGGNCMVLDGFGQFLCSCQPGFKGDLCEVNIDDCLSNKCKNGGTCHDLVQDYECKCPLGYSGKFCQDEFNFCSKENNPCRNGATCVDEFTDYRCLCGSGFTGRNCSEKVLDCRQRKCANGGQCALMDSKTNRFSCRCGEGFAGDFCEIERPEANLFRFGKVASHVSSNKKTVKCELDTCQHSGRCVEKSNVPAGFVCECQLGYSGKNCEHVHAAGFSSRGGSYARLAMPSLVPSLNMTIVLSTRQSKGIILFAGSTNQFFSVEIFEGYAKASFFIGNHQMSTGFSYLQVADGLKHTLEVTIVKRSMTIRVDDGLLHTVRNDGRNEQMNAKTDDSLFVGGLPHERGVKEAAAYHVRDASSFDGCISKLYINSEPVDFDDKRLVTESFDLKAGCHFSLPEPLQSYELQSHLANSARQYEVSDYRSVSSPRLLMSDSRSHSCNRRLMTRALTINAAPCSGKGQCVVARNGSAFVCNCKVGYSGSECERAPSCVARDNRKHFVDKNGCRSRKPIRQRICSGSCGGACCKPTKIKTRRVRLRCPNGESYVKQVPVVKKCGCVKCKAVSKRLRRVSFWEN